MQWYWSPAGLIMAATAPLLMGLAWAAWRRRPGAQAHSLTLLMLACAWWSFAYALELSASRSEIIRFWGDLKYLGILLVPPAWTVFVHSCISSPGRSGRLTPGRFAWLAVMPVLTIVVLANDATHDLFRSYPEGTARQVPFSATGPLFWVHAAYSYTLLLGGVALLLRKWLRASRHYRRQAYFVLSCSVVLLITNGMHILAIPPFRRLDVTPFALLLMGTVLVWGVLRSGLLPLAPLARHTVIERMSDGVLVLDAASRVVDANPAAKELLQLGPGGGVGQPAHVVLPECCERIPSKNATTEGHAEVTLGPPGLQRDYDLAWSVLRDADGRAGGSVLVLRDVTERKQAEARLARLAHYDPLTGLPNRKLLTDRLEELLAQGQRFGVLFCDLDRFKRVNDTLGHDVGDAVLRQIADRLVRSTDDCDTVARLGGDEFVVLAWDVGAHRDLAALGRRLVDAIARPVKTANHELYLTASVGVAWWPHHGNDQAALLQAADRAMYRAKARGRNRVELASGQSKEPADASLLLERDLHLVVAHGELDLRYQPITSLADGNCLALEALLRWRHPTRGLLKPHDFIPIAEQSDLIHLLGRRVLVEAARQAVTWQRYGPVRLSVNLSAREFRPNLAADVALALEQTGLDPRCLILEITETVVLHDGPETLGILSQLKELGVGIATDDFGTGYTSLEQLRRYPLDMLKIDASFVQGLARRQEDERIVRAMIALGHDLGLQVVGEGVETQAQRELLRAFDCDAAQGFLFSEPLTGQRAKAYLANATGVHV